MGRIFHGATRLTQDRHIVRARLGDSPSEILRDARADTLGAMKIEAVAAIVNKLPRVTVGTRWNNRTWIVKDRGFVWERPLSKADIARYGDATPPSGDIIAIVTEDLDAKDAILSMELPGFFTIPHFNGYAAVLVELRRARTADVRTAIQAAWTAMEAKPPKKAPRKRPRKAR